MLEEHVEAMLPKRSLALVRRQISKLQLKVAATSCEPMASRGISVRHTKPLALSIIARRSSASGEQSPNWNKFAQSSIFSSYACINRGISK
jgi:hypothetical protein